MSESKLSSICSSFTVAKINSISCFYSCFTSFIPFRFSVYSCYFWRSALASFLGHRSMSRHSSWSITPAPCPFFVVQSCLKLVKTAVSWFKLCMRIWQKIFSCKVCHNHRSTVENHSKELLISHSHSSWSVTPAPCPITALSQWSYALLCCHVLQCVRLTCYRWVFYCFHVRVSSPWICCWYMHVFCRLLKTSTMLYRNRCRSFLMLKISSTS